MHGAWPVRIWGDLAVPNCRMFLRIFVIERSEHLASLAICDVVSVFLLRIIWTIIVRSQDSRFRAILLALYVDGTLVVGCVISGGDILVVIGGVSLVPSQYKLSRHLFVLYHVSQYPNRKWYFCLTIYR